MPTATDESFTKRYSVTDVHLRVFSYVSDEHVSIPYEILQQWTDRQTNKIKYRVTKTLFTGDN